MKKAQKIKVCDWALLIATPLMLLSSIWLEATGSRGITAVWLHIILGIIFFALVGWHFHLHLGKLGWIARFKSLKSRVTKILTILALLTLLTAIIATAHWFVDFTHSGIGAWHGKIGFLMLAVAIGHTVKRFSFFRR